MADHSALYTAALWYAKRRLAVFPCAERGKPPLLPGSAGYKVATADVDQVRAWWTDHPQANIGLPCAPNQLLVADIDPRNGGDATLSALTDDLGTGPRAVTGSGGRHLFYRLPAWQFRGTAGPGIDIKANGYVIAAPSVHPDGPIYRWERQITRVELTDVPPWLEAVIRVESPVTSAELPDHPRADSTGRMTDTEVATAALTLLKPARADGYDEWIAVGMALQSVGDESLLGEWIAWSRQSPAFVSEGDCEQHWRSFGRNGVTVGTLISMAREDGDPDFLTPGWHLRQRPVIASAKRAADDPARVIDDEEAEADERHCNPGDCRYDDIGNAERFIALHGDLFRYCFDWRSWLHYDGMRWAVDGTAAARTAAKATARSILLEAAHGGGEAAAKHAVRSASRDRLEAMLYLAQPALAVVSTDLDACPWDLNCTNGTVDLRTGDLRPHSSADLITRVCSSAYRPGAHLSGEPGALAWDRFLTGAANGDSEYLLFLQRLAGYSATGDPCEEILVFAYGIERTGKSTFLGTIGHHLGDYADTCDFTAFLKKRDDSELRPELAKLQGRRFVATSELDPGRKLAEGLVKTITGGETISTAAKYRDPITWRPAFTLWAAANDRPIVRHDDGAFWRRCKVAPFLHQVPIEDLDIGLKAQLREEAGEAVLAWIVEGCLMWQADGLGTCAAVQTATAEYREEMDPIGDWLADCCLIENDRPDWWTSFADLNNSYTVWCQQAGTEPELTSRQLSRQLTRLLGKATARTEDGTKKKGYETIRLP